MPPNDDFPSVWLGDLAVKILFIPDFATNLSLVSSPCRGFSPQQNQPFTILQNPRSVRNSIHVRHERYPNPLHVPVGTTPGARVASTRLTSGGRHQRQMNAVVPGGATAFSFAGESRRLIETLCMSSARDTRPEVFGCLDSFVECLQFYRGAEVHPKEVFAYWTICAQDRDPRKRLSLERALSHLPFNWDHPVFEGLSGMLRETAA